METKKVYHQLGESVSHSPHRNERSCQQSSDAFRTIEMLHTVTFKQVIENGLREAVQF